ncbi:putative leucine-rich repeat domain superfamily [Helianthus anomalus]
MKKLKLLNLKYVELIGSYEDFPDLIWLCWHGCPLQTMPSGLLMSSLVSIDMSYGHMEKFEAPTVLISLKRLWLKGCDKLVCIYSLYRLPKLEVLILWNCSSLTHLCKSIGDLENLKHLNLEGCTKLWKCVNQPEKRILSKKSLFSLPRSLWWLELINCGTEFNNDVCVTFHAQSFINLFLACNLFEYLPNTIDLKMLRLLNLYCCPNLKSLPCIPSTLEELHIDWCTSLEIVTFQSGRFTLQGFTYECCFKLSEVQGLFKLVPIAKVDETDLGDMQWIKAYEDLKVDLVGDEITKGRIWHTQMLYEYGIRSTYLQGIKNQRLPTYEYTSSNGSLSFRVPFDHGEKRIKGLNVSCIYRAIGSNDRDLWYLFAKISNRSKGLTWVYNPGVYCKPRVEEDVVWLSYWPIGNILDVGDEVSVAIYVQTRMMMASNCGASLVYAHDNEVDEENCDNNNIKEEVIGGDLSEFEVTTRGYYLCRHDLFGSKTLYWLKYIFGDNIHYTDSQGWKKTHQTASSRWLKDHVNTFLKIIELGVGFNSESEIENIEKVVSNLVGVESVATHKEKGKLIVTGYVDPIEVATRLREFDNMEVEILSVKTYIE